MEITALLLHLAYVLGFTPVAWLSFVLLGFGLLIHITLVNIVLGMSIIVPITEYIGYKTKDPDMERLAKRLFRYLALSDLMAGVFGTWVAIELTAFWPTLLYMFSTILFIPTLIAIIGIFIAIPSIAIYWYGWDRMSKRKHLAIGGFMALGAILVPVGFRMFFAFVEDASAFNISSLTSSNAAIDTNLVQMFTNPIYVTLLTHSWFGGLTMASLFACGAFGWAYNRDRNAAKNKISRESSEVAGASNILALGIGKVTNSLPVGSGRSISKNVEEDTTRLNREVKYFRYLLNFGLILLIIQSAIGVLYFFILEKYSPYVYAAITGNTSVAAYNFAVVFVPFICLVGIMWASTVYLQIRMRRSGSLAQFKIPKLASLALMVSSFCALPLGEGANDASKAPYMILTGTTGIAANSLANSQIPINWNIAVLAFIFASVAIAIFLITVYYVFVGKVDRGKYLR